jgi:hypothetical protein
MEENAKKKQGIKQILLWATGLWLICASIYGLIAYIQYNDDKIDYGKHYKLLKKGLEKNGYQIIKSGENRVQFRKKEWVGTYYVEFGTKKRLGEDRQNLQCKISFYPKDRTKRPDRWKFIWETLSESPKLVGVINFIAKAITKDHISGLEIQEEIKKKFVEGNSKSVLIIHSKNGRYHFRIKPFLSKVACEFVMLPKALPGRQPYRKPF